MFHKILPVCLLLFTGCLNDSNAPVPTVNAAMGDTVSKLVSKCTVCNTTDGGSTWHTSDDGLPAGLEILKMVEKGERLLIATAKQGLFVSDTARKSWQPFSTEKLPSKEIKAVLVDGENVYVSVKKLGLFATFDEGKSWQLLCKTPGEVGDDIYGLYKVNNEIWAGFQGYMYALTEASSYAWQKLDTPLQMSKLVQMGPNVLAATGHGVSISKDQGKTWEPVVDDIYLSKLFPVGDNLIAMSGSKETVFSKDNGLTWKFVDADDTDVRSTLNAQRSAYEMLGAQDGVYGRWSEFSLSFFMRSDHIELDFLESDGVVYVWTVARMDGC
ncbi:MAG: hypothetical protein IT258_24430 [Saprospiraceae bacterium]|nr:hypothetical protein [Saprospiraceae bacterium]